MDVSGFMGGNFLTQLDLPQPYQVWTNAMASCVASVCAMA